MGPRASPAPQHGAEDGHRRHGPERADGGADGPIDSIVGGVYGFYSTTRVCGLTQAQALTIDENEIWPDEDWSEWYDGSREEDWPDDDDWKQFD